MGRRVRETLSTIDVAWKSVLRKGQGRGGVGAVQGKVGIRDFKVKQERDSGLKVCTGGVMPKITLGITGLHEIMGQDYKIKEPHWGLCAAKAKITHFSLPGRNHKKKKTCLVQDAK